MIFISDFLLNSEIITFSCDTMLYGLLKNFCFWTLCYKCHRFPNMDFHADPSHVFLGKNLKWIVWNKLHMRSQPLWNKLLVSNVYWLSGKHLLLWLVKLFKFLSVLKHRSHCTGVMPSELWRSLICRLKLSALLKPFPQKGHASEIGHEFTAY